ncbi:hypothetical protein [Aquabacterium sp.]|nr:hypothetical protein [Aquabacterium sp.]
MASPAAGDDCMTTIRVQRVQRRDGNVERAGAAMGMARVNSP